MSKYQHQHQCSPQILELWCFGFEKGPTGWEPKLCFFSSILGIWDLRFMFWKQYFSCISPVSALSMVIRGLSSRIILPGFIFLGKEPSPLAGNLSDSVRPVILNLQKVKSDKNIFTTSDPGKRRTPFVWLADKRPATINLSDDDIWYLIHLPSDQPISIIFII